MKVPVSPVEAPTGHAHAASPVTLWALDARRRLMSLSRPTGTWTAPYPTSVAPVRTLQPATDRRTVAVARIPYTAVYRFLAVTDGVIQPTELACSHHRKSTLQELNPQPTRRQLPGRRVPRNYQRAASALVSHECVLLNAMVAQIAR